ncbi:MAG: hypothetical protein M0Z77_10405 [Thermoplasmatales archaeon]|jgi:hypothetical protein|nr:hypothetical protein [Candidatus Thermoplasmatota archaeon]MCL6003360.1 hypothetical protein [Candidatus Thermoplasmatota archaeon]MDA8056038.1 hypothetical protein [Thermoplasmatales archaeon]
MNRIIREATSVVFLILAIIVSVLAFVYPSYKLKLSFVAGLLAFIAMYISRYPPSIWLKLLFTVLWISFVYTTLPG